MPDLEWTVVENDDAFKAQISGAGDKVVFVDFMAEWCGNCENLYPTLMDFAGKITNENAIFLKVDVDDLEETAQTYEVTSMPRVLAIKNGNKVGEMFGTKVDKYKEFFETQSGK